MSIDGDLAHKGNGAACLGVVRRRPLNTAGMHADKRSIRRKFTHAQPTDVLLAMIRDIRRRE